MSGLSAPPGSANSSLGGRALGEFTLREQVGAGGFGDVYLADQVALGRDAIVKVLRPSAIDDTRIQRFLREAKLASQLDHPYAAHIYAFGAEPDGVFWIAMERVRGTSLGEVLSTQGAMAIERFVPFFERICEVVHTAHEQGIVHRDLKPDNVMVISRAGRMLPKLLDLGVARAIGDASDEGSGPTAEQLAQANAKVTTDGGVIGSPAYMAPELWVAAKDAGPAADQYALAALAYEALTGRLAFTGRTVMEVARAHAKGAVAAMGDAFPGALEAAIRKGLARRIDDRFGNVLELAQAIRAAAGLVSASIDLPQLDDALRQQALTQAPQPIADAVAAYHAAKNAHQAREALRSIVRTAASYVGVFALACRTRAGAGASGDSERAKELLRDLRRAGLTPRGWVALAEQLTKPFVRAPDSYPVPELVLALHPTSGANAFAVALEGTLSEALADPSEDAASQAIARELPIVTALLRALMVLDAYPLVATSTSSAIGAAWMGVRTAAKRTIALTRELAAGSVAIIDDAGAPIAMMSPLVQVQIAVPGHEEFLFLLAGPGRRGAKLISPQHAFEHEDATLWDWFRDHLFASDDARSEGASEQAPYRGLAAYQAGDAAWYVGRERETEVVINRLKLEPFVALVGPSGVGKSSFVHAGVVPSLEGWKVVSTRPGRAPIAQLGSALARVGVEFGNLRSAAEASLDEVASELGRAATSAGGLLVVIDQFEELFTLGASADERTLYAQILLAAARTPDVPLRVVVTLRDDFLIRAEQLPGLSDALARGLQLVGPLSPAALERILVEPTKRAGYTFEDPQLPTRMVAELSDAPAAVALLSFTASRMWELRDRHFHQLPKKAYDAIGGVAGALAQHADDTVEAMPVAERTLVRKAFRHLVTYEGTRAVLDRAELEQLLGSGADATRLLDHLVDARLLTSTESDKGGASIEVVHEALLSAWPRLVEWRREDADGSRFHEQLRVAAKQWHDRGRPKGLLWRGDALAEYQLWRKRTVRAISDIEREFGDLSRREETRSRQLRSIVATSIIVGLVVGLIFVQRARRGAEASAAEARSRTIASLVEQGRSLFVAGQPQEALAYLAASRAEGSLDANLDFLISSAEQDLKGRLLVLRGHTAWAKSIEVSKSGRHYLTAGFDRTTRAWDADSGQNILTIHAGGDDQFSGAEYTADDAIVTYAGDEVTTVWNEQTGEPQFSVATRGATAHVTGDGQTIITLDDSGISTWSAHDGRLLGSVSMHPRSHRFVAAANTFVVIEDQGIMVGRVDDLTHVAHVRSDLPIRRVSVNSAANRVAAIDDTTKIVLVWDLRRPLLPPVRISGHTPIILGTALSPDGSAVATMGMNHRVELWDCVSGTLSASLDGHQGYVMSTAWSSDGKLIATGSADRTIRIWNSKTGELLHTLYGNADAIFKVLFDPTDKKVLSAGTDNTAQVFAVPESSKDIWLQYGDGVTMALDRVGRRMLVLGFDGTAWVIDLTRFAVEAKFDAWKRPMPLDRLKRLDLRVRGDITSDGEEVLLPHGNEVYEIRVADRTVVTRIGGFDSVTVAAFAPENSIIAGDSAGQLAIWNRNGELRKRFPGVGASVTGLDVHGDRAVAAFDDGHYAVVDLGPHPAIAVANGLGDPTNIVIAPNGSTAMTSGNDSVARSFDVESGRTRFAVKATSDLTDVDVSSDGLLTAFANRDGIVDIRDSSNGRLLARAGTLTSDWLTAARFGRQSGILYTGDDRGRLRAVRIGKRGLTAEASSSRCRTPFEIVNGELRFVGLADCSSH